MRNSYLVLVGCCLLGVFLSLRAHAQTNFQPGYVLPLVGDTLRGEIDSRDGRASAQRCRFRATAQGEVATYQPTGLRGYGLRAGGKQYRALTVAAGPAAARPYFLEVLADGPASLYFLRDAGQHEFYYVASPQQPVVELRHAVERVVRDGRTYSEERNDFRTTLAVALAGCAAAQSPLPSLPFQESALRKVVHSYNACHGYQAPPLVPVSHTTLGIVAGVVQHNLYYSGFPYSGATVTSQHVGFAVGPTLSFSSPRLSKKLSMVLALLYESEKYELTTAYESFGGPGSSLIRTRFDLAYLRLPVLFRYTYPRGKVSPLAEVGFSGSYAVKTNNSAEQVFSSGQSTPPQTLFAGDAFRSIQLGAAAGLGLSTRVANGRALALLARAEATNGFSNSIGAGSIVLHFYGLLSFDFTK